MSEFAQGAPAWWDARYRQGSTPWDQGIPAPEVLAFAAQHPGEGRWALDIGCGTGTHGRALARSGYRVAGIDLSWVALQRARAAAHAERLPWVGVQGSAEDLALFALAFAMALDVGCLHTLDPAQAGRYAQALRRRVPPGGHYLLYAVHPRQDPAQSGPPGLSPGLIEQVFGPGFDLIWRQQGWQGERRSDWWLWQSRSP
ncbi:MAG: methyltransferase domain-containing protein [Caldilineales bacterium]|nr:methyltransferase domain-containing protein [Caldilineales bacterium]